MANTGLKHSGQRSTTHRKRLLAVRAMAAEIAWLSGRLCWHNGQLGWRHGQQQVLVPGPAELSLAERRLKQIRRYPRAGQRAFGDLDAWLAFQHRQLELAKWLAGDATALLAGLASGAPLSGAAAGQLARLLPVEMLCLGELPCAPSAALLACGPRARPALEELLGDEHCSRAGRALAALLLGALGRAVPDARVLPYLPQDPWLARCLAWGQQHGLPPDPALVVLLLDHPDGHALAGRLLRALSPSPFRLPAELLRDLSGLPAEQLVALAEAAAAAWPLARRIMTHPEVLPQAQWGKRGLRWRNIVLFSLDQRRALLDALVALMHDWARESGDPAALERFSALVHQILDRCTLRDKSAEVILAILQPSDRLARSLRPVYLELLLAKLDLIWRPTFGPADDPALGGSWLNVAQAGAAQVARLLRRSGDPAIVAEALELDLLGELAGLDWQRPERYRLFLALVRGLSIDDPDDGYYRRCLGRHLGRFDPARASALWLPALRALAPISSIMRGHISATLLESLPEERGQQLALLPRLWRHVEAIARFTERYQGLVCPCGALIRAAIALERELPEQASGWLAWTIALLDQRAAGKTEWQESKRALELALSFGQALAQGRLERFQQIVRAALLHELDNRLEYQQQGALALARLPSLHEPLALLFPQQPQRCARLIINLGLVQRLGPALLGPLALLEPALSSELAAQSFPQDWQPLIALVPELAPLASAYLYARWLCGAALELPPGVRRALEQPQRYARECQHLELLLAAQPERAGLAARLQSLRARLDDQGPLLRSVRAEVGARLQQICAEAQLAAAEQQVLACYRARLEQIAGPRALAGALAEPASQAGSPDMVQALSAPHPAPELSPQPRTINLAGGFKLPASPAQPLAGPVDPASDELEDGEQAGAVEHWPPAQALSQDHVNAALLSVEITTNRRLLARLLRATLAGDRAWRMRHPANRAFLDTLEQRGISVEQWLGAHVRSYRCPIVAGGRLSLHLEQDPLRILQMGNYFDTCLSFDGFNAFSTVANACELNKRVLYASDGAGRIVGRKLIGISREGALIGFYSYSSLSSASHNELLRTIMNYYLAQFAGSCGLVMADSGELPMLFAEAWYDDGVVSWADPQAAPAWLRKKRGFLLNPSARREVASLIVLRAATRQNLLSH